MIGLKREKIIIFEKQNYLTTSNFSFGGDFAGEGFLKGNDYINIFSEGEQEAYLIGVLDGFNTADFLGKFYATIR